MSELYIKLRYINQHIIVHMTHLCYYYVQYIPQSLYVCTKKRPRYKEDRGNFILLHFTGYNYITVWAGLGQIGPMPIRQMIKP